MNKLQVGQVWLSRQHATEHYIFIKDVLATTVDYEFLDSDFCAWSDLEDFYEMYKLVSG